MTQPTTAGAWLNGIWDMLAALGLDPAPIFVRAGVPGAALRDPHERYQSDQLSQLWNVITEATGNQTIALAASDCPRPAMLDLLTYTMMTAPDMQGALQRFIRYIRVISDATTFTLDSDAQGGQWLHLSIEGGQLPVPRQRYEFILISIFNICRWIAGRPLNPLAVAFTYCEPGSTQPYTRAFGGPLHFGADNNGILFSAEDLRAPLPASNPRLAELHERFAGEFLQQMDRNKMVPKVRDIIVRLLPDGEVARSAVAAALCISERTLQRRLQDEGTSFAELFDATRRDLARQFLAQDQMALGQLAFMLGFADQSAFSRACQRWFDQSPGQYRKQRAA